MMLSETLKENLILITQSLGEEAERIKSKNLQVEIKQDNSPLTNADNLINHELNKFILSTDYRKVISEENKEISFKERKHWDYYWLIDPIDGTKEFINKGTDYTINIALCSYDSPIFSIVYAPARKELYTAEKNHGAYKNRKKITTKQKDTQNINVVASKSHLNKETSKFIQELSQNYEINLVQYGSSLKICKIAEGAADIYPRFGPTMEWDTCAADLILQESGGKVNDINGQRLKYNKQNLLNPFFIASA